MDNNFSLHKTIQHIINSAPPGPQTPVDTVVKSMLSSFLESEQEHHGMLLDKERRDAEASLNPDLFIDEMKPVAIFNRFDLADSNGKNCGEYRIVYARDVPVPDNRSLGRFTMIFEATYPNPIPEEGSRGCLPVAKFWDSLTRPGIVDLHREWSIWQFLYQGITQDGIDLPPAINFHHYQGDMGQIRVNMFVQEDWQLREFRTGMDDNLDIIFSPVSVKTNPVIQYLNEANDNGMTTDQQLIAKEFRDDFINKGVRALSNPEFDGLVNEIDILNSLEIFVEDKFNNVQSAVNASSDATKVVSNAFRERIRSKINGLGSTTDDPALILERLNTQTCAGCHELSNEKRVFKQFVWPKSLGFVHVNEQGDLSEALLGTFLPRRVQILEDFICDPPLPVMTVKKEQKKVVVDSEFISPMGNDQVVFNIEDPDIQLGKSKPTRKWKGLRLPVVDQDGKRHRMILRGAKLIHTINSLKQKPMDLSVKNPLNGKAQFLLIFRRNDNKHLPSGTYRLAEGDDATIDVIAKSAKTGQVIEMLKYKLNIQIERKNK
ncbi:hypothetical protein [Veronia pacifica]|nr:hypothetical protein [Veronia pacifica]